MDFDYIIIGSGFGGSVCALRLSQKGYKVLVIEKGKWFSKPDDFPKSTWDLRKWYWLPKLGGKGIFQMSFFSHVTALSGVGVGGGSLVYANTLPIPKAEFFNSGSWQSLADWQTELIPHYATAKKMLGAEVHPYMSTSDKVMQTLAGDMNGASFEKSEVAVYFGKPDETVADPYFDGQGPNRTGCILCGGCMLGCRYNAKNTLDKNYLYLAQNLGAEIWAEQEVYDVKPLLSNNLGTIGYEVFIRDSMSWFPQKIKITTKGVIFSGGVIGTMKLLLKLKKKSLPNLSSALGHGVRTNSESLIGVTSFDRDNTFSDGIAIGSIVHIDEKRKVEPVKYSAGSGIWRLLMAPMVTGGSAWSRLGLIFKDYLTNPIDNLKVFFVDDWSKRTHILLYMESIDSTIAMVRNKFGFYVTKKEKGPVPTAFNPKAQEVAHKVESIINGKAMVINMESIMGIPTTAHILGGACMGKDESDGVIDKYNRVYNYPQMYVCDGSMISANPGVNPSLSITAITELAMSFIPNKENSNT